MRLLMLVSVVCFLIALLGRLSVFDGVDVTAWAIGGLLAWSLDVLLSPWPLAYPPARRQ
jgi:hypothetical protein